MRHWLARLAEPVAVAGILAGLLWGASITWQPVRVSGMSMHPALHAGDLVLVRKRSGAGVGQIALLEAPGHGAVLHRVVATETEGAVRTRGDANPIEDRDATPMSAVIGHVTLVVPIGGTLERWRGDTAVGYDSGSIEQSEAMTETARSQMSTDQGRAP